MRKPALCGVLTLRHARDFAMERPSPDVASLMRATERQTAWGSRATPSNVERMEQALSPPYSALNRDGAKNASAAHQAGGDLAVDVDERAKLLAPRLLLQGHRLVHHEQAEIGHVLAQRDRQRMLALGGGREEHGPQLAVIEQRLVEVGALGFPLVADRLQPRGGLQEETGFKLPRRCNLLRYRSVSARPVLHFPADPSRMR